MEDFIATVRSDRIRELLEVAIMSRDAFRRFKDVLLEWLGIAPAAENRKEEDCLEAVHRRNGTFLQIAQFVAGFRQP
jgi:hypothetical protein